MKLILQAIKSIFRKVDKRLSDLSTRIQIAQDTADTAQAMADTAQAMADSLVVTVRYVNNVPVISHTNEEIYNAHQAHRRVILSAEDNDTGCITNSSQIYSVSKEDVKFLFSINQQKNYISIEYYRISNNEITEGSFRLAKSM